MALVPARHHGGPGAPTGQGSCVWVWCVFLLILGPAGACKARVSYWSVAGVGTGPRTKVLGVWMQVGKQVEGEGGSRCGGQGKIQRRASLPGWAGVSDFQGRCLKSASPIKAEGWVLQEVTPGDRRG